MIKNKQESLFKGVSSEESSPAEQLAALNAWRCEVPSVEEMFERREGVEEAIYDFARNFAGFYESELDNEPEPVLNPAAEVSADTYRLFFNKASEAWGRCEEKIQETGFIEGLGKDGKLKDTQESIAEDASRVAEAIVMSVASNVADDEPSFSRLLSRLDMAVQIENHDEDEQDRAMIDYASSGGSPPSVQMNHVMDIALTGASEGEAEDERVDLMQKVYKKVKPILEFHGLLKPMEEWLSEEWTG